MSSLSDKTVVVTGGAGLLGSEFCRACAREGANVVVADRDKEKGAQLAAEISATFEPVDVSESASVKELAERVMKKFGRVDGVVNAAYPRTAEYGALFEDATVENMLKDLDFQVGGCLSIAKAFAPYMRSKGGSIIYLGSIYGVAAPRFKIYEGTKMTVPAEYAAAKGGVIALSRYLAALFGPDNIRVNAVSPGGIADGQPQSFVDRYSESVVLGKGLLSPSDVSGAVVFLLSDASQKITGQNIVVDAGWTL